jgi:glycosyltransferase involved in cell wall biosynthesis
MISIIIPTLNEEGYIEETLLSIKSKLTLPHEIIVSDGGSKDKTIEIAHKYANSVVEHTGESRQNISQGRNAGAEIAGGKFLVFIDADVRIDNPDVFFKHALYRFENEEKLVAITARLKVWSSEERFSDKIIYGIANFNAKVINNILHKGEATGEFQMIKKDVFESLGGFREDLITREDADMFLRLSRVGRTAFDPKLVVLHSGRRAHKIGAMRLFFIWTTNIIWVTLFDKAKSKEWTVIR